MWTCAHCSHFNLAAATACAHCATPRADLDRSMTGARTQADAPRPSTPRPAGQSISGDRTYSDSASPASDLMRPGLRVGGDGRYELIAKLGEGGMGSVWRAKDLKLTREVAIKRIRGATSPALQERFLRETRALTGLSHPNVVTVFDAGEDAYGNYLVMELVSGKTLAQRLKEGPIEASQAVDLFCAMCKGMSHAHKRGVIHRDLKPSNVMLNDDGVARILDFGLVRLEGSGDLSLSGVGLGTLDYASPEQKHDGGAADERSDVFALGLVFYEMLTGRRPAPLHLHKVGQPWREVIAKATEPEPQDRYRSMEDLLFEMEQARSAVSHDAAISRAMGKDDDLRCPSCGLLNLLEARFCRSCSTSLLVACPACEASIRTGLRRCDKCGADVRVMRVIRGGLAEAVPLVEAGKFAAAEQILRPLLRETLDGPVGSGEGYVRELERLLARCRAGQAGEDKPERVSSSSRRRGRHRARRGAGPSPMAMLLAAGGIAVLVILALAIRGKQGSVVTTAVVEQSTAPRQPEAPVRRPQTPTPSQGGQSRPSPSEPKPRPAAGGNQGEAPPVVVPTFTGNPANSKEPPPIPTDVDGLLEEWLSGAGDQARREKLLAALEAIVFPGDKPGWVVAMRKRLLAGGDGDLDGALLAELETAIGASLKAGSPAIRFLLPWIESALRVPKPSLLLRWGGLEAWIGCELPAGPSRAQEIAESIRETLSPIEKDSEARAVLKPLLEWKPILRKALSREIEVAKFLLWGLSEDALPQKLGPLLSGVWLEDLLSRYALHVYDDYFGPDGSGLKADVLLAANIWLALDGEDAVAKLIWAMATGSAELENDQSFPKAVAGVKTVAPWFAGLNWQEPRDPVMQRLQRLRLPEICGDIGVQMSNLQQTYAKRLVVDVDMAFPDRMNIDRKIAGLSNSMRGRSRNIEQNRSGLDESDIPVDVVGFSRKIRQLESSNNVDGARLAKWWRAKSRLAAVR